MVPFLTFVHFTFLFVQNCPLDFLQNSFLLLCQYSCEDQECENGSISTLMTNLMHRDGIFKHLRRPGINSKESILPAYVAWRAGTTTPFLLGS